MTLLAQFDHGARDAEGHDLQFRDYLGAVNPFGLCAPELGLNTAAEGCPIDFEDPPAPGVAYTLHDDHDIVSPFVQVKLGNRFLRASGAPYIVTADTAVTGGNTGRPPLGNTEVPFVYLDSTARNNFRYFYAVTAFDVNSIQSGPSSFESPKLTKSATPMHPAGNYDNAGSVSVGVFGRGVNMSARLPGAPTIDPTTGVFSGPARPATGASLTLLSPFVKQLVTQSGEMSLTLLSMTAGSVYSGVASTYEYQVVGAGTDTITVTVLHDPGEALQTESGTIDGVPIDAERVLRFGGSGTFHLTSSWSLEYPGSYLTNIQGRGCANAEGTYFVVGKCEYNGARWFDGATESFPHPTRGNTPNSSGQNFTLFTNAGSVAGVANIWEPRSYETRPRFFRQVEGVFAGAATAADYRLFWGAAGAVDSVVDITHNVLVPFDAGVAKGYTWGFLTQPGTAAAASFDGRTGVLTTADLGCVVGIKGDVGGGNGAGDYLACGAPTYSLTSTVAFGPVAMANDTSTDKSTAARPNPGFGIYMPGHFFLFEMAAPAPSAPAPGTVWTLRTYTGGINGGGGTVGTAGNDGPYAFVPALSPFTAVGASLKAQYSVTNQVRPATRADLARVHTIPDPFYLGSAYAGDAGHQVIKFVNLPAESIIRIYTASGILSRVIEHRSTIFGGSEDWDVRNRDGRLAASGVYFYHIEAGDARHVGRMTIVTSGR